MTPAPFQWPPRPESSPPGTTRVAAPGRTAPSLRSSWSDIEHAWLDVTAPPLAARLAAARFRLDEPWDYCPRCGETVGEHELDATGGCAACADKRFPWTRMVRLGEYDAPLDRLVQDVKFTSWRRLGEDLGRMLGLALAAAIDEAVHEHDLAGAIPGLEGAWPPAKRPRTRIRLTAAPIVLVPAPTAFFRRLIRGIDHPLVIARGAARELGVPVRRVLRRQARPSQTGVPSSEREANIAGAMSIRRGYRRGCPLQGKLVVVLDDVVTTGATMRAACRQIRETMGGKQFKGQIWAATVARTPDPTRQRRGESGMS